MSTINHAYRHAFVQNPKTAGISIGKLPWVGGNAHWTLAEMEAQAGEPIPPDYLRWCFVRNPIERFTSAYYSVFAHDRDFADRCPTILDCAWRLSELQDGAHWHFEPQWCFAVGCQYIGRFERLADDLARVAVLIGIMGSVPLQHSNMTAGRGGIDAKSERICRAFYARDFETFGY